jgi:hypothetical protein
VEAITVTMETEEAITLFDRLADAVRSRIPVWLALLDMTDAEVAALEGFLEKCDEQRLLSEEIWKQGDHQKQKLLSDLLRAAHRGR